MSPWDGMKRRAEDGGNESPDVVLARIDERVKSGVDKVSGLVNEFQKHVKDDEEAFKAIRDQAGKHAMYIYMGMGILTALQFLLKH
jgi:hypothetical protein